MSGVTSQSLKEKHRQEREDLILQVAEEMLAERGYHDTSMDEIAQRVGVSKGTVYQHFANKEELILALAHRPIPQALQDLDQILASALGPRDKLKAIFQFAVKHVFSKRAQLVIAFAQTPEVRKVFAERHEQWHQTADEKHESLHRVLEQLMAEVRTLLEAGKTTGTFEASVPTDVMLSAFLSLLSPLVYRRLLGDQQMPTEQLAEHLWRIYFNGIAAH